MAARDDSPRKTAAQLVGVHVQKQPQAWALSFLDVDRALQHLTFQEVWTLARGVATLVSQAAAACDKREIPEEASALCLPVVAVAIDDGPYLAIAELGGWIASCCITPVDPHDPVARVVGILEEIPTLAAIVCKDWGDTKKLTEVAAALQAGNPDSFAELPVLDLSRELPLQQPSISQNSPVIFDASKSANNWARDAKTHSLDDTLPLPGDGAADPDSVAYLWYTSGSTGKPKGCLVPHRAFSNWCTIKNAGHGIDASSVVLIASASTFDPSIGDTFATWAVGGQVAVASRMLLFAHLGWVIKRLAVTHLTCTPSLWGSFDGAHPEHPDISSLRVICLGGERMGAQLLQTWTGEKRPAGSARLLNTYGTTECTVWQTLKELGADDTPSRVGFCLPGNTVQIVDHEKSDGELSCLEAGATGEILQGGVQVGLGYFRRPERSAAAFLQNPSSELPGSWYRTGDGGRLDPKHGLEVVGRFDNQVKVRGMRVELGDIEQAVTQAGAKHLCNACCAVMRDGMIQAFVQLETQTADLLLGEVEVGEHSLVTEFLLQGAARLLPRHMLPSRFLLMRRFALGRTGKVDRKALPDSEGVIKLDRQNKCSSLTKLERVIAAAWGDVLGVDASRMGPQDHFLALGGNSVSVLRVSRKLTAQAKSQGAVVSPDGPVAFALAPERLIHSPRLQQYCNVLEKAGMAQFFLGSDSLEEAAADEIRCAAGPDPASSLDEEVDVAEAAQELRINYTKMLVTERRIQAQAEAAQKRELDHAAWEQVPKTAPEDMLFRAVSAGVFGVAAMLLEEGETDVEGGIAVADMPVKGKNLELLPHQRLGLTPLHVAIAAGHEEVVRLLLKNRADPSREDYRGCPPLHKAAERGSQHIITALLDAKASVWSFEKNRRFTALHAAAKAGNVAAVDSLLAVANCSEQAESIADGSTRTELRGSELLPVYVNLLDRWSRTPLHWTIVNAHSCCAQRLVDAGATVEGSLVEERGKLLIHTTSSGTSHEEACSSTCGSTSKRSKNEAPEDPWRLAQQHFGEDGGPFCKILRGLEQLPAGHELQRSAADSTHSSAGYPAQPLAS